MVLTFTKLSSIGWWKDAEYRTFEFVKHGSEDGEDDAEIAETKESMERRHRADTPSSR